MIIKSIKIEKFRGFRKAEFELGKNITVIAGQNGTQKTTLLGMVSQPFSVSYRGQPFLGEKPLCGGSYRSGFSEKFKLSEVFDKPKSHEWTLRLAENNAEFTVESMPRARSESDAIRFWKKSDRSKGSGYIPIPVIYLSLSRLFPIGEDLDLDASDDVVLTEEEAKLYAELHNKILIIPDVDLKSIDYLSSSQKKTLGANTDHYDWRMNSAGQDNIGKIILAILSFKRLKKEHPDDYKGGLLVIDELDATLYPASQIKLIEVLRKWSSKLSIQIIFTTHSLNILEKASDLQQDSKLNGQVKVVFLKRSDDQIRVVENANYDYIRSMLNNVLIDSIEPVKIRVFTEDRECIDFCKAILGRSLVGADYIDCNFGCDSLLELVDKGVPGFRRSESVVVLDGDVSGNKASLRKANKHEHVAILPGQYSPERELASYLHALKDEAPEWDKICKGYRKQLAFEDYSLSEIRSNRDKAKQWYKSQARYWGRGNARLIKLWKTAHEEECSEFVSKIIDLKSKYH